MFELGEEEERMHREIGEYAAEKGIDVIIAIGSLAQNYKEGVLSYEKKFGFAGTVFYFPAMDEVLKTISDYVQPGDSILVKASHGMHFEKMVEQLQTFFAG
jgi:UDP-N-acetylmuramoyl-tripeptide--D-alanyl-D-alanine ligase